MSATSAFPRLRSLDFSDPVHTDLDYDLAASTRFSDLKRLFSSALGAQLQSCMLRNMRLSPDERSELAALSKDCQVQLIPATLMEYM